jgi:sugar fermentation stimulation protein A
VHAELADGTRVTAHTNNPGRLTGCGDVGARCWLSRAADPRRKLAWTLEVMEAPAWHDGTAAPAIPDAVPLSAPAPACGQVLVGVNTAAPSSLVAEAVAQGLLPALAGCTLERREARYPEDIAAGSRADLLLRDAGGEPVWVEVKNVTWVRRGTACFPDAPTARGRKHLADLERCVAAGQRAALVLCVQRGDAVRVAAAADVDPAYAETMQRAAASGVDCLGLLATVTPAGLRPDRALPVITDRTFVEGAFA